MQMPGLRAFSIVQEPWGWAHILVQKPRGARGGGMVTRQIDTYINFTTHFFNRLTETVIF